MTRTRAVIAGVLVVVLAWGVHAATALPDGPDALWARVFDTLGAKHLASVATSPNGDPLAGLSGAWFEPAPGHPPDLWDSATRVSLECEVPFARKVIQLVCTGRNDTWARFAFYRSTGEERVVAGERWSRYARDD